MVKFGIVVKSILNILYAYVLYGVSVGLMKTIGSKESICPQKVIGFRLSPVFVALPLQSQMQ